MTKDMEDSGWLPLPRPEFGSQPLTDRRREAFARALFEGIDAQAAYELAGFKRPRSNAQRMEREPLIQARVNYLRRELDRADLLMLIGFEKTDASSRRTIGPGSWIGFPT